MIKIKNVIEGIILFLIMYFFFINLQFIFLYINKYIIMIPIIIFSTFILIFGMYIYIMLFANATNNGINKKDFSRSKYNEVPSIAIVTFRVLISILSTSLFLIIFHRIAFLIQNLNVFFKST